MSKNPILLNNEVHIWSCYLPDFSQEAKNKYRELLTEAELQKLSRFYFEADRDRFLIGRAVLKEILGLYLLKSPTEIQLSANEFGKPYLEDHNLFFNVSHSKDFVLIAISYCSMVGVDIEYCKERLNFLELAKQFCSEDELTLLRSLSDSDRCTAFYRCWTQKEAFVKAIGKGLYFPLDKIKLGFLFGEKSSIKSISLDSNATTSNVSPDLHLLNPQLWLVHELSFCIENNVYQAAFVVKKEYDKTVFLKYSTSDYEAL